MLVRIVSMYFKEETCGKFMEIFEKSHALIRASEGCLYLELLRDKENPAHFITHSHWIDEASLEKYRHSDLFKKTWVETKVLFEKKAEAWSFSWQKF